ncbi:LacI family DNA-binding transcriptional regulator [Pediococcus claussenii]|uniref:Transcriptional regulator, LacI family n=1 Tax=Pediococcus claussenii (strain ATCC BAA-344 / DSM 14800 / JCM 18046 / KCTC 3811 / LMG 21948 / P06) TaxID=701521 RepID=G8PBD9_PEDCP|nr:LacI family DNA-binding transcriptional regulator [Pediococcus claussenii]AEV95928.1 Transcriptional regulator, LacI family [Pediococcus claussenii ATCC BAA-344]ANZ69418.1 LacI family transcriptional regulator [Pediococcus claussenii]ANZ71238.1 LacI family transcriptional regulator [Pediococcus claussenii]KRN20533.1 hypothetical protein IV79_GL000590 [Pediococcus claussenii]
MPTLNDVARLANVSKMTVSRVINHPDKVRDDLKKLVYEAMRDLDYHPNIAAKALVNNRTQIIKFLILEDIDVAEPYYMKLLVGIATQLSKMQYSLQLVTRDNIDVGNCDAFIVTGMRKKDTEWIKSFKKPVVIFGENHEGLDSVDVDNKGGTKISTKYALQKGYKKIVFIGLDREEAFEYSREAGYIETMQQLRMKPEIHRMSNHSHSSSEYIEKNWKDTIIDTCFVCGSDRLALGIERGIQKCGGDVPNDFGIIGFDGVFLNQVASPKLTTIKQPEQTMGIEVAKMVIDKVNQNNLPQGSRLFEPQLEIAKSTR